MTDDNKSGVEKCSVVGCVGHGETPFSCNVPGDAKGDSKTIYKARVHFTSQAEMVKAATESVKRKLQEKWGRKGTFPSGRVVDVTSTGELTRTSEDYVNDIMSKSAEQREKDLADLRERIRLVEARMSVQSPQASAGKK